MLENKPLDPLNVNYQDIRDEFRQWCDEQNRYYERSKNKRMKTHHNDNITSQLINSDDSIINENVQLKSQSSDESLVNDKNQYKFISSSDSHVTINGKKMKLYKL